MNDVHFKIVCLGVCLTTDMDFQWHMNNARYLRECDFGRVDLWLRNGVWDAVKALGGGITLGASTIRYRKSLRLFDTYMIRSKVKIGVRIVWLQMY